MTSLPTERPGVKRKRGRVALSLIGYDPFEHNGKLWASSLGIFVQPIYPTPGTHRALLTAAVAAWKIRAYLTARGWPIPTAVRGPDSEIALQYPMHIPLDSGAGLIDELGRALREGTR